MSAIPPRLASTCAGAPSAIWRRSKLTLAGLPVQPELKALATRSSQEVSFDARLSHELSTLSRPCDNHLLALASPRTFPRHHWDPRGSAAGRVHIRASFARHEADCCCCCCCSFEPTLRHNRGWILQQELAAKMLPGEEPQKLRWRGRGVVVRGHQQVADELHCASPISPPNLQGVRTVQDRGDSVHGHRVHDNMHSCTGAWRACELLAVGNLFFRFQTIPDRRKTLFSKSLIIT